MLRPELELRPCFIRASNGSFGLLVILHHHLLLGLGLGLLLPVETFPDAKEAVE